ncbi:unnamed protein product [Cylicocyclus nassatus]|uniref:Uncharacterized protein n=1 Tax=Cylicocyclus nassatus TaxID=53992 RepID=A0AA36DJW7_CYLNA|nr:unnamed protein product [Cylicocyclus nassatus]
MPEKAAKAEAAPRPVPPKVVITQPSSAELLPSSLTASIDTLPPGEKKKCCVIL